MITTGGIETHELADGWTQVTNDGSDALGLEPFGQTTMKGSVPPARPR